MTLRIGVVGAGVVGLSTAFRILQEFGGALGETLELVVLADKFDTETTSDGAAGIFRPNVKNCPNTDITVLRKWCQVSWNRFHNLFFTPDAAEIGVSQLGGYHIYSSEYEPDPMYKDIVYHFHYLTQKELRIYPPGGDHWKGGYYFNTLMVECRNYLPWLKENVIRMGGKLANERVDNLKDLAGRFDVIIHCSGLGARQLSGDMEVVPIRGQMIRANAPQLKQFYFFDDDSYAIPGAHSVAIGGVRQRGNFNLDVTQEDKDELWRKARERLPILTKAKTMWNWVGLRPYRDPIRVEGEMLDLENGRTIPVVHNYGHGGNGVSLSWGTAVDAVEILKSIVALRFPHFKVKTKSNL